MYIVVAVGVDQNDRLALQETKRHQPFLAVVFPDVLASGVGSMGLQYDSY